MVWESCPIYIEFEFFKEITWYQPVSFKILKARIFLLVDGVDDDIGEVDRTAIAIGMGVHGTSLNQFYVRVSVLTQS